MRIGNGYDVHKLVPGRKLIIGGVEIPHETGLLGHSDADVLTHAVIDCLFGAAGLPDIGSHFPDTDPKYKGADSILLLRKAACLVREAGYEIGNVDCILVAQAPKMAPHIPTMKEKLADAMGIPTTAVGIKAKTEEGLGFTGSREGMAAYTVCLLL